MTRTRQALYLAVGLAGACVAGVLALELLLGNWWHADPWLAVARLNVVRDRRVDFSVEHLYASAQPTIRYSRDANGLRGSCAQPREIEILTIGGSTTDQRYVGDGHTWQDGLQQRLTAALGRRVCVTNAGVDGHSSFGHLAALDHWLPLVAGLRPRLVVLYIGINDAGFRLQPNEGYDTSPDQPADDLKSLLRERSALVHLAIAARSVWRGLGAGPAYAEHAKRRLAAADYVVEAPSPGVEALVGRNTALFEQRLSAILLRIRERGATPVCVSQPHRFVQDVGGRRRGIADVFRFENRSFSGLDYALSLDALNAAMQRLCTADRGHFVDLAARPFAPDDFYDPVHHTPAGASRIAGHLAEAFERQGIAALLR